MDSFQIIQNFFTRMQCQHCDAYLEPEGVELIRHEVDVYVVNVFCLQCDQQMGVAMVCLESAHVDEDSLQIFEDPELLEHELERFEAFDRVSINDVISAHRWIRAQSDAQLHQALAARIAESNITLPLPEDLDNADSA